MRETIGELGGTSSRRRLLLYLSIVFVCVHVAAFACGVRFDATSTLSVMQFLDPELLSNRLLSSCFYLHIQPPLFNLCLGAVLKVSSGDPGLLFHALYLLMGLGLCWTLFLLQLRMGVSRPLAFLLTTLFIAGPPFLLYEHLMFYTHPSTVLLGVSALLLYRFLKTRSRVAGMAFFGTLFLLAGIRSAFHLFHFLAVVAIVAVALRDSVKRVAVSALPAFVLLLSLYVKNLILFGCFAASTWGGGNLWYRTVMQMPEDQREALVSEKKLSELSLIYPYSPLESYPASYREVHGYEDVPALREITKSTGAPNYNNLAYLAIERRYLDDAVYVLLHHPTVGVGGTAEAWFDYFKSSSHNGYLAPNRRMMGRWSDFYDRVFYGRVRLGGRLAVRLSGGMAKRNDIDLYVLLILMLPVVFVYGLMAALPRGRVGGSLEREQRWTMVYICFNIAYIALLGGLLATGENNRFRYMTDPLYLVLLGYFLQYCCWPRLAGLFGSRR